MGSSENIYVADPFTGKRVNVEANGGLAVNIQDQHTRTADLFFSSSTKAPFALTANGSRGNYTILAAAGHGAIVGNELAIFDTTNQLFATVGIAIVNGTTITLDRPLPHDFDIATTLIQQKAHHLNLNGSVIRRTFSIGPVLTAEIDIVRIMFLMTTTAAPTMPKFGDLAALTKGVIMRKTSLTEDYNYFSVKSNADLVNLMYDVQFFDPSHPSAVNGLGGRLTYGGQNKHGVTIRLGIGEALEVIIQDDLRDLLSFHMIATGHEVTD